MISNAGRDGCNEGPLSGMVLLSSVVNTDLTGNYHLKQLPFQLGLLKHCHFLTYQCHLAYEFSGSAKEIFCCVTMIQDLSHMICAGV